MSNDIEGLVVKRHTDLTGRQSHAVYSPCEKYRYYLERRWSWEGAENPLIMIMLNPSTATEYQNDPTVERCERRARQNGFTGMQILNIFAYRATDPREMMQINDPVGPDNNFYIERSVREAVNKNNIVCGWGTHGAWQQREERIFSILQKHGVRPHAFKWTKNGHPQHPLYVSYAEKPKARLCL